MKNQIVHDEFPVYHSESPQFPRFNVVQCGSLPQISMVRCHFGWVSKASWPSAVLRPCHGVSRCAAQWPKLPCQSKRRDGEAVETGSAKGAEGRDSKVGRSKDGGVQCNGLINCVGIINTNLTLICLENWDSGKYVNWMGYYREISG